MTTILRRGIPAAKLRKKVLLFYHAALADNGVSLYHITQLSILHYTARLADSVFIINVISSNVEKSRHIKLRNLKRPRRYVAGALLFWY